MNWIEQLADKIITDAFKKETTDIHIIPRKKDTLIQFRVVNKLIPYLYLQREECDRLISHFKFQAAMDIGERRRPQSGAYTNYVDGHLISMRLSTLPTAYNESLVIRLLPQSKKDPHHLSLFPQTTRKILALLKHAHGLIIFTGPTGSGKTTTLYSLLNESSRIFNRNIITLEDPVEKNYDNVLQVQVNEKAGITYSTGLKAILRHDPDLIMVGEIRDAETAQIAVRASLTGHLVLSTMHTRDAKGAIYRLLEFGVNWIEIEQTLVAVTAQRLVELACPLSETVKRAAVFEILYGRSLVEVLREAKGEKVDLHYEKLKDIIKKGIALGFIKESEYERWVYEYEKV
ncbi:type II/IV secretion system protein [Bacillus aquiflavi]|uniref:Type II/IV secretion system protein n=1 Tax=Bacillus aquiflavi TaxID=2672567 RepID=A0A6B3VWM2_9BACI|nr:competence type IV pilus ATPase ComGA [Bacillus aquiflavi]MBA4535807.1 type II/IV secretion system protein [Bacillus aquiflavi]NEY80183.1 type II/IV secretion system protein [Bacillus aquiflavi]UAC47234.1 GspE/PulE family protein [Bacillus aquiflavi]